MQNVRKMASIVNYVKPEMEMVEIETEGSLLLTASFHTGPQDGDTTGQPGKTEGGAGFELRSSKPKVRR